MFVNLGPELTRSCSKGVQLVCKAVYHDGFVMKNNSRGDRVFPVAGSRLWDSLSPDVTLATTPTVFRNCLKT